MHLTSLLLLLALVICISCNENIWKSNNVEDYRKERNDGYDRKNVEDFNRGWKDSAKNKFEASRRVDYRKKYEEWKDYRREGNDRLNEDSKYWRDYRKERNDGYGRTNVEDPKYKDWRDGHKDYRKKYEEWKDYRKEGNDRKNVEDPKYKDWRDDQKNEEWKDYRKEGNDRLNEDSKYWRDYQKERNARINEYKDWKDHHKDNYKEWKDYRKERNDRRNVEDTKDKDMRDEYKKKYEQWKERKGGSDSADSEDPKWKAWRDYDRKKYEEHIHKQKLQVYRKNEAKNCTTYRDCVSVSLSFGEAVECVENKCRCRTDLGFTGDATKESPCTCPPNKLSLEGHLCLSEPQIAECANITLPATPFLTPCKKDTDCLALGENNSNQVRCFDGDCVCNHARGFTGAPEEPCTCTKDRVTIGTIEYCLDLLNCVQIQNDNYLALLVYRLAQLN